MNWNEVEYYLISESIGKVKLEFEPINWNEDEKQIIRNTESWGVFTELSNDLQFVKDGADILEQIYNEQGTEVEVILERYVVEDIQKGFILDYRGNLDMKTYVKENNRVSVQFLTGGLQSLIESQFDEAYELERDTDINGNAITELGYDTIYWEGRRIFLESFSGTKTTNRDEVFTANSNTSIIGQSVNTEVVFNSEQVEMNNAFSDEIFPINGIVNLATFLRITSAASTPNFFIIRSEEENLRPFNFIVNYESKIVLDIFTNSAFQDYEVVLALSYYDFNGSGWVYDRASILKVQDLSVNSTIFNANETINEIILLENQGLALTPYIRKKTTQPNTIGSLYFTDIQASIKLEQNSEFLPTEFDGIRLYDAFNRMIEIYTGKTDRFASNYFDLGQFKDVLLSSGRQIRNLEEQRLSVELKDLFETNNYFNLGWSVENRNNKEVFVVEDKSYFFVDFPLFDLGEVSKLTISSAEEFLYKSCSFGNKKAGDYEEVQGLQEYNAFTTYQTHLKTAETKYEVEGKIRADLVGAELARRKNITVAPNEDTRYDEENFLFDCKPYEETKFTPKVWQDQLSEAPICYDPATAGNLLLTPFRSMQRHGKTFGAGLTKYRDKFTRFSSGTGALEVATRLAGEPLRYENGNIINSDLDNAIYEAEYYEFEYPLNIALRRKLREKTLYQGKEIPNTNFLVKFTYRKQEFTGYIVEVGFNDPGSWKLIKKNAINGI